MIEKAVLNGTSRGIMADVAVGFLGRQPLLYVWQLIGSVDNIL